MRERLIHLAHSPDPDDAYMFYGLLKGGLLPKGWRAVHVLKDIQSLNRDARRGRYEVTAISAAAYPAVAENYRILSVGASVGRGYGPVVVRRRNGSSRRDHSDDWTGLRVATPGPDTTALMVLRLARRGFRAVHTPFDRIPQDVRRGRVDAGLVIHEAQVTWARDGLKQMLDLGAWWMERTQLPLPLGLDVVRRDLGPALARRMAALLRDSILYADAHSRDALAHALRHGRGIDPATGERFVRMYVNRDTLDLGSQGARALRELYRRAFARGLISHCPAVRPVRPARVS